ncbi:MAG TPA: hypothetical protein V6D17_13855 [Candidatus Obscuribacterales bacterium]
MAGDAKYDPQKSVEQNAQDDFQAIKETFEKEGARAAYQKMTDELNAVAPENQKAYKESLAKALSSGDNPLLPKMAVAYLEKNQSQFADDDGRISATRIQDKAERANEKQMYEKAVGKDLGYDPLAAAFTNDLANRYQEIKKTLGSDRPKAEDIKKSLDANATQAKEAAAKLEQQQKDKDGFAKTLLNTPGLFNMLDGMADDGKTDGYISKGDTNKFLDRWNKDASFRELFAKTPEEQDKIKKSVEYMRDAIDNRFGETMPVDRSGWSPYITKEAMARGMGYGTDKDAVAKMEADLKPKEEPKQDEKKEPPNPLDDPAKRKEMFAASENADYLRNVAKLKGEAKEITKEDVAEARKGLSGDNDPRKAVLDALDKELAVPENQGKLTLEKLGVKEAPHENKEDQEAKAKEKEKAFQKTVLDRLIKNPAQAQAIIKDGGLVDSKPFLEEAKKFEEAAANESNEEKKQAYLDNAAGLRKMAGTGDKVDLNKVAQNLGFKDFKDYADRKGVAPKEGEPDPKEAEEAAAIEAEKKSVLEQATQKAGEGPWQASLRVLGIKDERKMTKEEVAAARELTEIFKKNLVEQSGAKSYNDALNSGKLTVGYNWMSPENIDKTLEAINASNNETLKARFAKMQPKKPPSPQPA